MQFKIMKTAPRIIVFSTPSCGWCRKVKSYLKEKGFRYRDVDISKDSKAAQDVQRKTGQTSVPIILINNKPIIGFNRQEIDRLLKQYN
jgi:glutaredoxin 3